MLATPNEIHLRRFRELVAQRMGLLFDDARQDMLAGALTQGMAAAGWHDYSPYLEWLCKWPLSRPGWQALAERLTINETYFFRNPDHFRAVAEVVLPACMKARAGGRQLRILSAGCASGEEAYSLAIVLRDTVHDSADWDIHVLGVDVNRSVLDKARRKTYSPWSLRGLPDDVRERCFSASGRDYVLHDQFASLCAFEELNLKEDDAAFWRSERFDVIFCRNVTMYFAPEIARLIVARLARSLRPGGFLFLGHAETLRGVSQEFHLRHTHETFYYQLKEDYFRRAVGTAQDAAPKTGETYLNELVPLADVSWVDAIRAASERIAVLTHAPDEAHTAESPAYTPGPRKPDLSAALELLRQERYTQAIEILHALPPESEKDADAQLLSAALLTNTGQLADAETICRELLARDELNAGAHYLMALCREHRGDDQGMLDHDRMAIYLDASFAMPHLHLGLRAKRKGNLPLAEDELAHAAALLSREEAARILLFGGGFGREVLMALCEAERQSIKGLR